MIANGALFGVTLGTLLSLVGTLGAGLFGFSLGRRGGPLLNRLVPAEEQARANDLLKRWGDLAVVATRPVPILAETVAILAGASPMTWGRMMLATAAGALPARSCSTRSRARPRQPSTRHSPCSPLFWRFPGSSGWSVVGQGVVRMQQPVSASLRDQGRGAQEGPGSGAPIPTDRTTFDDRPSEGTPGTIERP